jgi:hypothetical protein
MRNSSIERAIVFHRVGEEAGATEGWHDRRVARSASVEQNRLKMEARYRFGDQSMDTQFVLGETTFRVKIDALAASCPNFPEDLPSDIRSPVGANSVSKFVGAVQGPPPVLTTENIRDLWSLQ